MKPKEYRAAKEKIEALTRGHAHVLARLFWWAKWARHDLYDLPYSPTLRRMRVEFTDRTGVEWTEAELWWALLICDETAAT